MVSAAARTSRLRKGAELKICHSFIPRSCLVSCTTYYQGSFLSFSSFLPSFKTQTNPKVTCIIYLFFLVSCHLTPTRPKLFIPPPPPPKKTTHMLPQSLSKRREEKRSGHPFFLLIALSVLNLQDSYRMFFFVERRWGWGACVGGPRLQAAGCILWATMQKKEKIK